MLPVNGAAAAVPIVDAGAAAPLGARWQRLAVRKPAIAATLAPAVLLCIEQWTVALVDALASAPAAVPVRAVYNGEAPPSICQGKPREAATAVHPALRRTLLADLEYAAALAELPGALQAATAAFLLEMLIAPPPIVDAGDSLAAALAAVLAAVPLVIVTAGVGGEFEPIRRWLARSPRVREQTPLSAQRKSYPILWQEAVARHPAPTARMRPLLPPWHRDGLVYAIARSVYRRVRTAPRLAALVDQIRQWRWLLGDTRVSPAMAMRARARPSAAATMPPALALRVTHCIGSLGAGGSERQLCNLVAGSVARGVAVRVLTTVPVVGDAGYFSAQLMSLGVQPKCAGSQLPPAVQAAIARLPVLAQVAPLPRILRRQALNLLSELMLEPPDVVHTWLDLTNVWAGVAALLADVPAIVVSTRSLSPRHFPALNHPWFLPWYQLLAASPRVHFVNNSQAGAADYAAWIGVPAARFAIIRNGIDLGAMPRPATTALAALRASLGIPPAAKVVLGVMRLSEEKRPQLFLEAGLAVLAQLPDAHLVLAGDGPYARTLARSVGRHALGRRCHLLGQRRDAQALMAAADVLLLTSRVEGTPNVLLEAQWLGCPVVSTVAGGSAEALQPGVTGELVAGASAAELSAAVLALLCDDGRRQRMAAAGPVFVAAHFGIERMVDETLALYEHGRR